MWTMCHCLSQVTSDQGCLKLDSSSMMRSGEHFSHKNQIPFLSCDMSQLLLWARFLPAIAFNLPMYLIGQLLLSVFVQGPDAIPVVKQASQQPVRPA